MSRVLSLNGQGSGAYGDGRRIRMATAGVKRRNELLFGVKQWGNG